MQSAPLTPALVIFARPPIPGRAKTRLIPLLGREGAAQFQNALLSDTLSKALALSSAHTIYLALTRGASSLSLSPGLLLKSERRSFRIIPQRGADLGARLDNAFRSLLSRHTSVVIVGTDSPELSRRLLSRAFAELRRCEAVLGPCRDGGYYLVGLRRGVEPAAVAGIFRGVRWSTRWAFRDTLKRIRALGISCALLEPCADVDLPRDLRRLAAAMAASSALRRCAPETWRFLAGRGGA